MSSNQDDSEPVLHPPPQEPGDHDDNDDESVADYQKTADKQEIADLENDEPDMIPDLEEEDLADDPTTEAKEVVNEDTAAPAAPPETQPDAQSISSRDETASSVPDDTPSIRESILSSPGERTPPISSPARDGSPSSPRRPFDRRFQSRLSSQSLLSIRAASPAFLTSHSRRSSLASLAAPPSEPDESATPWEVIRWHKLRKLSGQVFSEIGKRNFGSPTCLAVTDHVVIGTSRGMVVVFDHNQTHQAIIGGGTKALECGAVTSLSISADHTTVAAGHATGHIFTWEIARPTRPFLHVQPIDISQAQSRKTDGHVTGNAVIHVGFLGYRRTALVSADDRGMAFSHLATRGTGAIGRTVRTTRILGRYPELVTRSSKPLKKSSVLAFSSLPLGNVEQKTDGLGLVAMLTPYLLVIVSTTPVAQTQHKAARPKEVAAHSAMTAALAWFPAIKLKGADTETSKVKLAYAWSNVLNILEVQEAEADESDKEKPIELEFIVRSRLKVEEAIVAIQWLSRSVLAVLTITQQLLIIEDVAMEVSDSFDILQKNIYHTDLYSQQLQAVIEHLDEEDTSLHGVVADAFHMSFRAYKGRLFLLGSNDVWWGSLTNWADRLLALMNIGDFIAAIRLATRYYTGYGEGLTIGLPENDAARKTMVGEKLFEMISASLKYAFGKNQHAGSEQIEKPQMIELAEACIMACLTAEDPDFLFETVFSWYDDHMKGELFMDVIEPFILDGRITDMPPPALKVLIDHFSETHTPSKLEEIICLLDTDTMDIDQVTRLCKKYNLFDAYVYVWNKALGDFVTPLEEMLQLALQSSTVNGIGNGRLASISAENANKMFPYLSFILTSRTYPTGFVMPDALASTAKAQVYSYLFSATPKPRDKSRSRRLSGGSMPYSNLRRILSFDTPSFISALNEAFEDSFLNSGNDEAVNGTQAQAVTLQQTTFNRQFIVLVMLEVMSSDFEPDDTIYLDMFVARNLPKYPQYMLLSGTALHDIFTRLCHYPDPSLLDDAQLSAEYLLSVYRPSSMQSLIPLLMEAKFYRVLKSVYRQEGQYPDVIRMYFATEEDQGGIFGVLREFLRAGSPVTEQQRREIVDLMKEHASDLLFIHVPSTATTVDDVAQDLHGFFLEQSAEDFDRYQYLSALLAPGRESVHRQQQPEMLEMYIRLMCHFDPDQVPDYVENVREGDLRLQEVLPAMEETGIVDAAVILQARSGLVTESMKRLVKHLSFLKESLKGLLAERSNLGSDFGGEARLKVLSSIHKYVQVGIWICQGQSKISQKARGAASAAKRVNSVKQPLTLDENLWLDLIEAVVLIAREISQDFSTGHDEVRAEVAQSLRDVIQQVFTGLLTATTIPRDESSGASDLAFLRILRGFLTNAARSAPSLSELRNVLSSIFSAYAHEESLLSLSNAMLDKDVFVNLDDVHRLRQKGWRPRGQVCEICRRRVWGPGIGSQMWDAWQTKEEQRGLRRTSRGAAIREENYDVSRGKGKATADVPRPTTVDEDSRGATGPSQDNLGPLVVFCCRHLYHQKCLLESRQATGQDGSVGDNVQLTCPACIASA